MGGKKKSKSMSGSYSMKGTTPANVGVKKGSLATNGNGPPPLSYPADPPDDENMNEIIEENVDVTVVLPDGSQKHQSVESNIPMMDLLINLAASNKLNPAAHSLVVLTGDKWKQIDFKANKTIGALAGDDRQVSVQIIKKIKEEKVKTRSTAQPFEMTYRFTVNLPHNQKKVLRISPKQSLGEVRQIVCKEKALDPSRYVFLLPSNPKEVIEDFTSVGDLKTSEINFVAISMIDAASSKSMPDLAFAATRGGAEPNNTQNNRDETSFMPSAGEKKAKRSFLSFLGKKDKKFKVQQDADIEVTMRSKPKKSESFHAGANSSAYPQDRPQTMFADSGELDHFGLRKTTGDLQKYSQDYRKSTGSALLPVSENQTLSVRTENVQQTKQSVSDAPPKKSGKKRAAPPPPQAQNNNARKPQTVQVEINVQNKSQDATRIEEMPEVRVPMKKIHSRNSSDSSGYHELTVSGADSPEANKTNNLQTTLDTTSIDSADHFNGDSGIRDMSPARRRSANRVQGAGSRESSLDIDKPMAPGRKKKRAPLPPPGMTAAPVESSSSKLAEPTSPIRCKAQVQEEEFSALQAMEEVTMKFDIDESDDDDMQMVENSSIHSEDIDISHRQRPAMFIPPPPPTEPPPDDSEQHSVNTVDIGVGDSTTNSAPSSAKSSPLSIPRRPDSRSSNSSVNTIEDLSLAFNQIIAIGQESLGIDSDDDEGSVQEELQKAMPEFRKHITRLTLDDNEEGPLSNQTQGSEQGTEGEASFLEHERQTGRDSNDSKHSDGKLRESSEITYEFTIDSVPADFQNEGHTDSDSEHFEMEEIIEVFPVQPNILELESPRKIPDLDSPKEHRSLTIPPQSVQIEESTDDVENVEEEPTKDVYEVPVDEQRVQEKEEFVISLDELSNVDFSAMKPGEQRKPRRESDPPKVNYRIEFRSSMDFDQVQLDDIIQAESEPIVNQEPVFYDHDHHVDEDFNDDSLMYDNGVKSKCSELSFSPNSEGEAEHLMEEKSISMIALPAERTPVKNTPSDEDNNNVPSEIFASSTQIVLSQSNNSPRISSNEVSPRSENSFESSNLMQGQYQQLQQQFTMWQNQLMQNQKLLANSDISTNQMPGMEDPSNLQLQQLQLQIQMQQQMMLQLQQSMHTLALQNTLAVQQPLVQPVNQTFTTSAEQIPSFQTSTPIPAAPPAPIVKNTSATNFQAVPEPPIAPAPPVGQVSASKPKASKADAKYTKPKQKRFERQLDPREQLMLDIRNFGKTHLHKVPVKATHWHK